MSPTASTPETPTRARFAVLGWLCAAAALAYIPRNAISIAESTVRADLGLSKEQSGWLMSAFFFSYALCQVPTAQFGQRLGSRRALPLFAIVWSAATAGTAFVGGLAGFVVARVVQGVAQAGLFPVSTLSIAKWFPKTGRAIATGALGSFMSVGSASCAWLTGVLLEVLQPHVGPSWNWRFTFLIFSVPGILWAAWFWRWFRDEPRGHPSVNAAEVDLIEADAGARGAPVTRPAGSDPAAHRADPPTGTPARTPWLALYSSPALWWICAQQACRAAGYMFFTSWFATYLQETRGVGIAKSGFLNMLPLLGVILGGLVGGATSDWLLRRTASRNLARRWMSMTCLFTCAGLIFSALAIEDALAAVLVISAGSFCFALAAPCSYTITIDMGGSQIATVHATMNMAGNLGAWAFPIAVPWLLRLSGGSWDAVLLVFGCLFLCAAVFWLLLKPEGTVLEQSLVR
ncbi:MAG: MFS transporter [Verrucomicrobia bacterium]|nr:MFS transporter [Verrucomicrobiota bacterium]